MRSPVLHSPVFQYAYLWLSTKFAVKKAAKILVPSEATKKDLMNFFHCCEDKIAVVRHGFSSPSESISSRAVRSDQHDVEEILEQFHLKPHEKFFLFVGRLEAKKNLVRLLQAFAKFREKHPEFRLILAGKRGTCFREILKTFHDLKLERAVFMPGYITEPEKSVLFAACQGFVFPSLYEGFGLPVLESFYYEKPILASKSGSLPEVCGDACVMVDAENVHSIAEGLERLVSPEVVDLLPRGRDRLRQFDWKKTAKKTLDIFLRSLHTSH
jgi:glycosyltransferase involved in cell wall biosynthesis